MHMRPHEGSLTDVRCVGIWSPCGTGEYVRVGFVCGSWIFRRARHRKWDLHTRVEESALL